MSDDLSLPVAAANAEHLAGGAFKTTKTDPGTVTLGATPGGEAQVKTDDMDPTDDSVPAINETGQAITVGVRVFVTHFPDGRRTVSGRLSGGTAALGDYRYNALDPTLQAGEVLAVGGTISGTTYPAWAAACAARGFPFGGNAANPGIPDMRGRSPIGAGTGPGLTNRVAGADYGAESHALTEAELPYDWANQATPGTGSYGYFTRFLGAGAPFNVVHPAKGAYIFVQVA